jgi:hypothetical protein
MFYLSFLTINKMLDSKFFFTLIGLLLTVFAICNTNMSPSINEGFWGNSMPTTVAMHREVHPNPKDGRGYSLKNNYQAILGDDKFISRPNYQGLLSPRMDGMFQAGANIKYNMPSYDNLAVPYDSLAMADMAEAKYGNSRENYGSSPKCGKGGVSQSADHMSNFDSQMEDIHYSDNTTKSIGDMVSVGDMTTVNSLGELEQPIVFDRFIFANSKSHGYAQGCPIRGDLPITPCTSGNWFNVHPVVSRDLNPGAMNVMGGNSNENTTAMADLMHKSSGGHKTAIAGVDMTGEFGTMTTALGGDINVTRFV